MEFTLRHNERHLGQSEDWIFNVSPITHTCNNWRDVLSRIVRSIRCHFKRSVVTLITRKTDINSQTQVSTIQSPVPCMALCSMTCICCRYPSISRCRRAISSPGSSHGATRGYRSVSRVGGELVVTGKHDAQDPSNEFNLWSYIIKYKNTNKTITKEEIHSFRCKLCGIYIPVLLYLYLYHILTW